MKKLRLDENVISKWFSDDGDNTHNITYDLNEDSVVIDIGGYTGVWAKQMVNKYNPNMYIIEPISEFYDGMIKTFENNDKVHLLNIGVGTEDNEGIIYLNGDATSSNLNVGESISVEFNTMQTILGKWDLMSVDLIQINIEGDEYKLLENMIETGVINKFKNIQVQFHLGIDDCDNKRNKIREKLTKLGYSLKFDYPFVWESWYK